MRMTLGRSSESVFTQTRLARLRLSGRAVGRFLGGRDGFLGVGRQSHRTADAPEGEKSEKRGFGGHGQSLD